MTFQRRILPTGPWLTYRTTLSSILSTIATRRHSILGHIRRQLTTHQHTHKALKLAVNARSGVQDTPHHGWSRPADGRPRTSWIIQIVPVLCVKISSSACCTLTYIDICLFICIAVCLFLLQTFIMCVFCYCNIIAYCH